MILNSRLLAHVLHCSYPWPVHHVVGPGPGSLSLTQYYGDILPVDPGKFILPCVSVCLVQLYMYALDPLTSRTTNAHLLAGVNSLLVLCFFQTKSDKITFHLFQPHQADQMLDP